MTSQQNHPGEQGPAEASASQGEDLAALLNRLVAEKPDKTPKDLATEAGISYPTLNAWMRRARGTSRVQPDTLRALVRTLRDDWGLSVTPAEMFAAVGRAVPGGADEEREGRLLKLFRQLPIDRQRDVVRYAEAQLTVSRTS
ncbi:helix-turn-helix transcriptional regulator [Streptomyces sp. NPDC048417]|uniref:helix-turn-helix domain-containing protein n=1 Tax=Streptomyces sp. NPDC048417 TaxID=3155387 RepID=UPI00341A1240